jgi:hypothetical protein
MKTTTLILGSLALAASAAATGALAHHSYAMFDETSKQTVTGTVERFDWTNPHGWIHVMVPDAQGTPVRWSIETGAPNGMARQGWLPKTIVPGDKITITFHPLRNGRPGGSYMAAVLPNGKLMGNPELRTGGGGD